MGSRSSEWVLLLEAVRFAALKHRDQRRKDAHGSPFINHPIEAAHLLAHVAGVNDPRLLAAAALHDVLEDTATSADEIEQRFGSEVRRMVEEVTDPPGLPTEERRQRQLASTRTASWSARVIRLADKAANLGALPTHWTVEERDRYLRWVSRMSAVLGGTNAPLEALLAERIRREMANPYTPAPRPVPPSPAAVSQFLVNIAKTLRQARERLSEGEELLDAADGDLTVIGIPDVQKPPRKPKPAPKAGRPRKPRFSEERWFQLAEPGVGTADITLKDARVSLVSIDGAPPFELSSTLAALLDILCRGTGLATDGFAPFQSYEAVALRLTTATCRRASEHSVVVAISRLREKLLAPGGKSPQLVETLPGVGARFRIRRQVPTSVDSSHQPPTPTDGPHQPRRQGG